MTKSLMILPYSNGVVSVSIGTQTSIVIGSYVPPPVGTAPYVLAWIDAPQSEIDALSARSDCLFICNRLEDGSFETTDLSASQRNAIRTKISSMGFTGAQYGLLNAAIQSSQNRHEIAFALATKAFFTNRDKDHMREEDVVGTWQ